MSTALSLSSTHEDAEVGTVQATTDSWHLKQGDMTKDWTMQLPARKRKLGMSITMATLLITSLGRGKVKLSRVVVRMRELSGCWLRKPILMFCGQREELGNHTLPGTRLPVCQGIFDRFPYAQGCPKSADAVVRGSKLDRVGLCLTHWGGGGACQ
ncbi:hypothetical protein F5141DRAFT_187944 [Pisolithus sp. B1]|nr:hypothetical protein F5141DRAFT_187944 [Pisolithus sp. B1]